MLKRIGFSLLFALMGLSVTFSGLSQARKSASSLVDSPINPVIISGTVFSQFDGSPLDELHLFRHALGQWHPIPFQVDEISAGGVYSATEDGRLDANDEMVFLFKDAGSRVTPTEWVDDAGARRQPRYLITVTNSVSPNQQGWVYLYRSTSLSRNSTFYVSWDEINQEVTAVSYTLGFNIGSFVGIDTLHLNGGSNVLDRQKMRLKLDLPFPLPDTTLTEEDLRGLGAVPDISVAITGPVRLVGGTVTQRLAFYGGRADLSLAINLAAIDPPLGATISEVRTSLDLLEPGQSGLAPARYFDSNTGGGVTVDGIPDGIVALPPPSWWQLDGHTGGFVTLSQLTISQGVLSHYYRDEATVDPADTGDGRSYADTGVFVSSPDGLLTWDQTIYFLAGDQGNVGPEYAALAASPPATTIQLEQPNFLRETFLPFVTR